VIEGDIVAPTEASPQVVGPCLVALSPVQDACVDGLTSLIQAHPSQIAAPLALDRVIAHCRLVI
jgi:hypothetical protein